MQLTIMISEDNLQDVAASLGYCPNLCDENYPTAEDYVSFTVTEYVRKSLASYRARLAASVEMAKQIEL